MKRLRVDESSKEGQQQGGSPSLTSSIYRQQSLSGSTTGLFSGSGTGTGGGGGTTGTTTTVKVISEGMQSGLYSSQNSSQQVVNYGTIMPVAAAPHSGGKPQQSMPLSSATTHNLMRSSSNSTTTGASPPTSVVNQIQEPNHHHQQQQQQSPSSFQRLKVEDALSYLDLVKFKFGSKPQVYNDFLDIMKEFKSQSIDTPGVIERVSSLFKGFPDLIVGFNTFLPPGYKIEVQRSEQGGYEFSVSVSVQNPAGTVPSEPQKSSMILSGSGRINMSQQQQQQQQQIGAGGPQLINQQQQLSISTTPVVVQSSSQPTTLSHGGGGGVDGGGGGAVGAPSSTSVPLISSIPSNSQILSIQQAPSSASNPVVVHHHSSSSASSSAAAVAANNYGVMPTSTNYGLSLSAAQAAVSHALHGHTDTPQNQPVEFNHAINYVNKIKNRFQGQPDKYKRFLEILHTYQKEQRTMKEANVGANAKHLTEQEVYSQVAKLFENQSDLLAEFGQFLPDATSHINQVQVSSDHHHTNSIINKNNKSLKPSSYHRDHHHHHNAANDRHISSHKSSSSTTTHHHQSSSVKRSPPYSSSYHHHRGDAPPPPKKHKISPAYRDVSLSEAGKYGTLNDYAFFDKVRKALRSQEVYNNFLRCLILFNQEIISKSELLQIVTPFLGKFPELLKWFREFMGQNNEATTTSSSTTTTTTTTEVIPYNVTRTDRPQGDHVLEIDLATAKRLGASYCIIPKTQEGQKCSGRTQLCKEVLNDQWVSFPSWSEDSTFVSSRKTQYEEYMYRCEDERFELDVVIETNASTIRILEAVNKKLNRMNSDELMKFKLDDCLGGTSPTLHQRALRRIYGDKSTEIIEGLKKNPATAVPVVLKRLKLKEDEWRDAQKGFNKIWREQNEKYYLKSLDHMGINFKQTDVKAIRTKSLFNEIETIFDERHEQNDDGTAESVTGSHLVIPYRDKQILDDAANLLVHHVKRQSGIQKGEKRKIKQLLKQFIPDLFFHTRQPLSDDEREDDDDDEKHSPNSSPKNGDSKDTKINKDNATTSPTNMDIDNSSPLDAKIEPDIHKDEDFKVPLHAQSSNPNEAYTLFMANNNWYIFLRLHAILCERLLRIYERAVRIAQEEKQNGEKRKSSTAVALRLKPKPQIEYEDYYPAFLDMVKNLLDGNMEANTYEDTLREMFGIHAYVAFTLDKVASYAVRQLQHCVTERTAIGCTELFLKEHKRNAAGGFCSTAQRRIQLEQAYQRAAEKVVQEENCFKIYIYKCDCKITIELLDTEPEDSKKTEEANKWNSYKECFTDITHSDNTISIIKQRSPVYLNRNLRLYKRRIITTSKTTTSSVNACQNNDEEDENNPNKRLNKDQKDASSATTSSRLMENNEENMNIFDAIERKLNERAAPSHHHHHPPERNETSHPGYQVNDDQECKFNLDGSKITFTLTKDCYLYKNSAFFRARKAHPKITKYKAGKFRSWLKKWNNLHVTDSQSKLCTDWLMGRGEGVVPNRTRVISDNDLQRTPYLPFNKYRVDRLTMTVNAADEVIST